MPSHRTSHPPADTVHSPQLSYSIRPESDVTTNLMGLPGQTDIHVFLVQLRVSPRLLSPPRLSFNVDLPVSLLFLRQQVQPRPVAPPPVAVLFARVGVAVTRRGTAPEQFVDCLAVPVKLRVGRDIFIRLERRRQEAWVAHRSAVVEHRAEVGITCEVE